ncbi:unnamed protein product [Gongylonema pulchrum]|uniref:MATH domain-containing protein n=1 Tax=Gongylonema pulchrum TaxID=637853 RepID=A0A183E7S2_9BILA|nr:unnamed protein product [Gongylonema pulchrum]
MSDDDLLIDDVSENAAGGSNNPWDATSSVSESQPFSPRKRNDLRLQNSDGADSSATMCAAGQNNTDPAVPPKRLFSLSSIEAAKHLDLLACGAEIMRSPEDGIHRESKTGGVIKLNISNMGALRTKVTTSFHTIANLPWRLAAKTECTKRTSNVKFFSVYIDCNPDSESTLWSCDAVVEFRLISQKPDVADFCRQFTNKFNYNSNNWGFPSFMEWSEILNVDKGYIRGDRVVLEAHITVQKVVGVRLVVFVF